MTQLSDEQQERVKRIREQRHAATLPANQRGLLPTASWVDIDFLLSLLDSDSQAAGDGCGQCGGPHDFDTSVPSVVWNQVIRARGLSDYLCMTCIVHEFVRVGQGFTATLWSEEFNGVPIEVVVNGQNAMDASLIQEDNNSLRNQISDAAQSIVNEADKVGQLMQSTATAMRDKCVAILKRWCKCGPRIHCSFCSIRKEVESLTLDQEKHEMRPRLPGR